MTYSKTTAVQHEDFSKVVSKQPFCSRTITHEFIDDVIAYDSRTTTTHTTLEHHQQPQSTLHRISYTPTNPTTTIQPFATVNVLNITRTTTCKKSVPRFAEVNFLIKFFCCTTTESLPERIQEGLKQKMNSIPLSCLILESRALQTVYFSGHICFRSDRVRRPWSGQDIICNYQIHFNSYREHWQVFSNVETVKRRTKMTTWPPFISLPPISELHAGLLVFFVVTCLVDHANNCAWDAIQFIDTGTQNSSSDHCHLRATYCVP